MEAIRIVSRTNIFAETETDLKLELTVWDFRLMLTDTIQKGLLFSEPKSTATNSIINQLKTSLSRTLDHFPPLAGRLATRQHGHENSISYFIDCNNSGAEFLHAIADGVSISDIIDSVKNHQGTSIPLLAVQVTELTDGIFIGCSINHSVVYGTSFWHFFNSWSEISRGCSVSKPPSFERFFDFPLRIPRLTAQQLSSAYTPPHLKQRMFNFSKQNIAKLKSKANFEIGEANKITSLQAVLSHLWRVVIRNKNIDPNQEVNYYLVIGMRQRLKNQPLPENYFGNAVQAGVVKMEAGEVVGRGLGHVALQMNSMVRTHTEEKVVEFLDGWRKSPRLVMIDNFASDSLLTCSSPWFDVYGNDFGWGKPIAVRGGPGNKLDGKLTVFEGAEEGSVDVEACLKYETLLGMEMDEEFMDAVTVTGQKGDL